jgi:hypothetical protein
MLTWLDTAELEELTGKRPRLKELLEQWRADSIKLDLWDMGTSGKKPLLLLARLTYESLGKMEYRLILSQTGKNGACYSWECPANMLGAKKKGGRPTTYGQEAKAQAQAMRDKKYSIRQIAKEMNCSTFTVQRLLK